MRPTTPDLSYQWAVLTVADEEVAYAIAAPEFQDNRGRKIALAALLQEKAPLVIIDFAKEGEVYGASYINEKAHKAGFVNAFRKYWQENQEFIGQRLQKASF